MNENFSSVSTHFFTIAAAGAVAAAASGGGVFVCLYVVRARLSHSLRLCFCEFSS